MPKTLGYLDTPEDEELKGAIPDAVEPGVVTIPSNPRKQKRPEPGREEEAEGREEQRSSGATF